MTNPSRTTLCHVFFVVVVFCFLFFVFFFGNNSYVQRPDDTAIKKPPKYPIPGRQERKGSYSSSIMGNEKNLGMRLPSFF